MVLLVVGKIQMQVTGFRLIKPSGQVHKEISKAYTLLIQRCITLLPLSTHLTIRNNIFKLNFYFFHCLPLIFVYYKRHALKTVLIKS